MKKQTNTTAIKIKWLANSHKLRFTQLNSTKTVLVDQIDNLILMKQVELIFNLLTPVKGYSLIVDNTQSDYSMFAVEFYDSTCFSDLILEIKELKNKGKI